jgi:hypothetical protein
MINPNIANPVSQQPAEETNVFIRKYEAWLAHKYSPVATSSYQPGFQPFGEFLDTIGRGMENWGAEKLFQYLKSLEYILNDKETAAFHDKIVNIEKNTIQKLLDRISKEIPVKDNSLMKKITTYLSSASEKDLPKYQTLKKFSDYIQEIIGQRIKELNKRDEELKLEKETLETTEEKQNMQKDRELYRQYRIELKNLLEKF